jgi:hypothetical protein
VCELEINPEFEVKICGMFFHLNCFQLNYSTIMADAENKFKLRNPDLAGSIFKRR